MGKFKEIDMFCQNEDRDGLIEFLSEHGITNPHKQANIYLEEYRMNKSDKIKEGEKTSPIDGYFNNLDEIVTIMSERISVLSEISDILSERLDLANKRIDKLVEKDDG